MKNHFMHVRIFAHLKITPAQVPYTFSLHHCLTQMPHTASQTKQFPFIVPKNAFEGSSVLERGSSLERRNGDRTVACEPQFMNCVYDFFWYLWFIFMQIYRFGQSYGMVSSERKRFLQRTNIVLLRKILENFQHHVIHVYEPYQTFPNLCRSFRRVSEYQTFESKLWTLKAPCDSKRNHGRHYQTICIAPLKAT